MTKQITAAERKAATVYTQDLKLEVPQSMTRAARLSEANIRPSILTPADTSQASSNQQSVRVRPRLKCQWETFTAISREVLPLIRRHYEEVSLNGHPFDPDWEAIFRLERAGSHLLWTARTSTVYGPLDKGVLVGYAQCAFIQNMHSCSTSTCCVEAIWLAPEWREGLMGLRYIRSLVEAVRDLKRINTIRVYTNDDWDKGKDGRSRLAILLERLKLRQVGTVMELNL